MADISASSSPLNSSPKEISSLKELLTSIIEERQRNNKYVSKEDSGFVVLAVNTFWTRLFHEHFIERHDDVRDDMLFFVRKRQKSPKGRLPQIQTEIEVYRRDSKKLPSLGDPGIDWEETVYLNLILQQFEYTLTSAVCTRTDPKNLQVIKRHSQRVYASPSKRRMDSKGETEEITYPYIFFTIDNFEEVFNDIVVRDGEMVCVELVASDKHGEHQGVVFLGSIRYDALKRVYDARASLTSKVAQRMSLGWYKGHQRVEFVRMKGPQNKGHAEMAVSRQKGSGPETPTSENFEMSDFEDQVEHMQRRMSDPSSDLSSFMHGFRKRIEMKKSRSENEYVDAYANGLHEVEAGNIRDELDETALTRLWGMRGFSQAWHWLKEKRRINSVALNAYITYVTLPWHYLIADILDGKQQPLLTF